MTYSLLRSKPTYNARSVSLPFRLHPIIPQVDEHLGLSGLENMYDCLADLLLLPHAQQSFAQQCNEKWVEVVLEKYLSLLDVCATAKDVSLQTKQDLQGILSILRRRREVKDASGYLCSRKKVKKVIQKSLKDLKSIKTEHAAKGLGKSRELLDSLNEVEAATIRVFKSLLSYISGTKAEARFFLASKLMHRKSAASKDETTESNMFDEFNVALHSLKNHKTVKSDSVVQFEDVQIKLRKMELSIQDIEEELECLFKRFIKTRVILLYILNQ